MSRILSIDTLSLEHEGLDYETIDLASSDLQTTPMSLESSSITSITVNENRLTQVERKVEELESHGNVRYDTTQDLTEVEQARARENIGIMNTDETDPIFTEWKENDYEEMEEMDIEDIDRIIT